MICLAIDTAGTDCAACIYDSARDAVLSEKSENIGKGHAERLMGIVSEAMAEADVGYKDLERIITTTGPGSFTGIRVAIATAKGFGLGLGIPVIGISNLHGMLEQVRRQIPEGASSAIGAVMDARRGELYAVLSFDCRFGPADTPFIAETTEFARMLAEDLPTGRGLVLGCQGECPFVLPEIAAVRTVPLESVPVSLFARIGAGCSRENCPPEPVYLRRADAAPQQGFAVERVS
ncbi:MAG: tRNA (adenosine(37)-N6)-threonylcarbamoyltransferase complex dimerization subunit type 1 TsaB [Nitratireductor sp.]|nr:tRNA (adenosine(37)-N6)-threonylcarbamoyltransferase complex dimerization subunit type 1 TsaB [Nitratireductor sp.]